MSLKFIKSHESPYTHNVGKGISLNLINWFLTKLFITIDCKYNIVKLNGTII